MGSCMWSSGSPRVTIAEPPLCMGERRAWQAMCHTNSGGVGSGRVAQPRNAKGQFERSVEPPLFKLIEAWREALHGRLVRRPAPLVAGLLPLHSVRRFLELSCLANFRSFPALLLQL